MLKILWYWSVWWYARWCFTVCVCTDRSMAMLGSWGFTSAPTLRVRWWSTPTTVHPSKTPSSSVRSSPAWSPMEPGASTSSPTTGGASTSLSVASTGSSPTGAPSPLWLAPSAESPNSKAPHPPLPQSLQDHADLMNPSSGVNEFEHYSPVIICQRIPIKLLQSKLCLGSCHCQFRKNALANVRSILLSRDHIEVNKSIA